MIERKKTYCINKLYRPRANYIHFDDTPFKDEYQLEVYLHALQMMKENGFHSIIDIGCGSAYKLITYLGEYETLGLEISPTYEWLLEKYPDRRWLKSDFNTQERLSADLVICSDVIEHVVEPDELLAFIGRIDCQYIIFSTPSRNLLYRPWNRGYWGPPNNGHHIREWSFREFREYISQRFEIVLHKRTDRQRPNQIIVCTKPR